MTNLMVLKKSVQKIPKGSVVTPIDDGTAAVVTPAKLIGSSVKTTKDNMEPIKAKDIDEVVKFMVKYRSDRIVEQFNKQAIEHGTLLVIPVAKRSCAIYEVIDRVMDHKPRLKIKYRQDLSAGFEPAPEDIGAETEIEEAWAMVIYLSNTALLAEFDIIDDSHQVEVIKSKYDGRLIVAMDDHLDEKKLAKLEKFKAGEAVAQEDPDEEGEENEEIFEAEDEDENGDEDEDEDENGDGENAAG